MRCKICRAELVSTSEDQLAKLIINGICINCLQRTKKNKLNGRWVKQNQLFILLVCVIAIVIIIW
ncbi:hypothetical protein [Prochlorococcus sp. MIT 1341]|uniref:hypothetical protein n=1 Tax=Prochlorococcus sp. MIT 1341 TaxID=3096221 RepID=UPI002A75404A|nr:hypothetical protein [Prochlorococcus sp. MIT 1341]